MKGEGPTHRPAQQKRWQVRRPEALLWPKQRQRAARPCWVLSTCWCLGATWSGCRLACRMCVRESALQQVQPQPVQARWGASPGSDCWLPGCLAGACRACPQARLLAGSTFSCLHLPHARLREASHVDELEVGQPHIVAAARSMAGGRSSSNGSNSGQAFSARRGKERGRHGCKSRRWSCEARPRVVHCDAKRHQQTSAALVLAAGPQHPPAHHSSIPPTRGWWHSGWPSMRIWWCRERRSRCRCCTQGLLWRRGWLHPPLVPPSHPSRSAACTGQPAGGRQSSRQEGRQVGRRRAGWEAQNAGAGQPVGQEPDVCRKLQRAWTHAFKLLMGSS